MTYPAVHDSRNLQLEIIYYKLIAKEHIEWVLLSQLAADTIL